MTHMERAVALQIIRVLLEDSCRFHAWFSFGSPAKQGQVSSRMN